MNTKRRFFSYILMFIAVLGICHNASANPLKIQLIRGRQVQSISIDEFETFPFISGDILTVLPRKLAKNLITTPDGHTHLLTSSGQAIRIPPQVVFVPYKEYQVPEHLCALTGAGASTLDSIGKHHVENYMRYMKLWPDMTLLEIGCGIGRDVFQLLPIMKRQGKYIGIDVVRESIAWLEKNVSAAYPNFLFYHFDASHPLYNPLGSKKTSDFALPAPDGSVDRIVLSSVFTHLFEDEIAHYLKEMKRVLAPEGLVYVTFFLYEENLITTSRNKSNMPFNLRFEHQFAKGCYINNPMHKTAAVAYTRETLLNMFERVGLKLATPLLHGAWSGAFADTTDTQDVAILTHCDNSP